MAIPLAKRFEFLDKETNMSVAPFGSDITTGVYNSPLADGLPSSDVLKELINASSQSMKGIVPDVGGVKDIYSTATRGVKGAFGTLTDLKSLNSDKVGRYLSDITGSNPSLTKSMMNVAGNCSANGLNYGLPGKPYSPSINCGSGKLGLGTSGSSSSCNASSYGDLLNKLTDGKYGSTFQDLTSMMRRLMSLAGYGYNLGMCGVFGALSSTFGSGTKDMLSRASGSLLGTFGMAGNTNAVLDIAKSSVGLYPLLSNPSAISGFLDNFKLPSNVGQGGYANMADRTTAGLELLDENWSCSAHDNIPSISSVSNYSSDLGKVFSAKLTDRSYAGSDLDNVSFSDSDFTMAAFGAFA